MNLKKKGLIVLINMIAGLLLNVICIILKCFLLLNVLNLCRFLRIYSLTLLLFQQKKAELKFREEEFHELGPPELFINVWNYNY